MKLSGKKIAFGLTPVFYAFNATIAEMNNIILEGGEVIPIMQTSTYMNIKAKKFIDKIEEITKREIIREEEEAENLNTDMVIIAPCSRKSYS